MNQNKQFFSVQMIAEAGVAIALSYVLSLFKIYQMPQGGSVSLSMLPIMFFAVRWGGVQGMIVGALFGLLKLLINPYIIHPVQLIMDYPLPYAFLGLAGISYMKDKSKFVGYVPFIILAYVLKFLTHFLSGLIYFPEYAPEGMTPAYYSFLYNLQYSLPELIISIIVIALLWSPLRTLLKKQK